VGTRSATRPTSSTTRLTPSVSSARRRCRSSSRRAASTAPCTACAVSRSARDSLPRVSKQHVAGVTPQPLRQPPVHTLCGLLCRAGPQRRAHQPARSIHAPVQTRVAARMQFLWRGPVRLMPGRVADREHGCDVGEACCLRGCGPAGKQTGRRLRAARRAARSGGRGRRAGSTCPRTSCPARWWRPGTRAFTQRRCAPWRGAAREAEPGVRVTALSRRVD